VGREKFRRMDSISRWREAVVNLAGRNIKCRYTPDNLRELTASRVDSVHAIATALSRVTHPPHVWCSGCHRFYGDPEAVCATKTHRQEATRWLEFVSRGKTPSIRRQRQKRAAFYCGRIVLGRDAARCRFWPDS